MVNCPWADKAIPENCRNPSRKSSALSNSRQDVVPDTAEPALAAEQEAVSVRYVRLDEMRERAVRRLREALATRPTTPQSVGEREAAANFQTARLAALDAAESGLVVRRLDPRERERPRSAGRMGLPAGHGGDEPLLVDWRAPAAQPFYTA